MLYTKNVIYGWLLINLRFSFYKNENMWIISIKHSPTRNQITDVELSNHRSLYELQQKAKPIPQQAIQGFKMTNLKQFMKQENWFMFKTIKEKKNDKQNKTANTDSWLGQKR